MDSTAVHWPYWPTLLRLVLALGIGLFVGIERERRRKEAGLRTFAFAALLGAVGGLLDVRFALLALALLGVVVIFLNVETIHAGAGAEVTTSAALFVTGFAGVLAGQGHTFTPTAVGVATAGLLAWKEPLAGFSQTLTESEFRSAVLLAILAFVVYPVLPGGSIDPWQLVEPRAAWVTVILIAALGFMNYVLLKLYGARGIELTGFLGGLVNSTVTVRELAQRASTAPDVLSEVAFKGVVLATAAMLVRNAVILGLFSPAALRSAAVPLTMMLLAASAALVQRHRADAKRFSADAAVPTATLSTLESPFSPLAALKFGVIFLALQIAGTIAQRTIGAGGFYVISVAGGVVSSASAVASAASLAAAGALSPEIAATGAVLSSAASALIDIPLVGRVAHDHRLTRQVAVVVSASVALGLIALLVRRI
jgi:uncharacterized membrane protein (DUF4010 family)